MTVQLILRPPSTLFTLPLCTSHFPPRHRGERAMSVGRAMSRGGWSALVLLCVAASGSAQATQSGAAVAPNNDLPNHYRTIEGWAQLGRPWGSTSAVEIDRDGRSVWVAERCGAN